MRRGHKVWIEYILNSMPYVAWDRFTSYENGIVVFGWIKRSKDRYKDFVVLEMNVAAKRIAFAVTSSAKYHNDIMKKSGIMSIKSCHRVERYFKPKNLIKLKKNEAKKIQSTKK